ncbi:MAG: hypothetical protein ABJA67_13545 [Chthonomonadales bacterium]
MTIRFRTRILPILILLTLIVGGIDFNLPAKAAASTETHESCICSHCGSGKACCCKPASTELGQLFLKAQCEKTGSSKSFAPGVQPPAILPEVDSFQTAFIVAITHTIPATCLKNLPALPHGPPPKPS